MLSQVVVTYKHILPRNSSLSSGVPRDRCKSRKGRWKTERKTVSFYDFDFSVTRHELVDHEDEGREQLSSLIRS